MAFTKSGPTARCCQGASIVALRVKINELFRVGPWYALAHPLAGAIFLGMMAGCGLRALAGRGVTWKGRTYSR